MQTWIRPSKRLVGEIAALAAVGSFIIAMVFVARESNSPSIQNLTLVQIEKGLPFTIPGKNFEDFT